MFHLSAGASYGLWRTWALLIPISPASTNRESFSPGIVKRHWLISATTLDNNTQGDWGKNNHKSSAVRSFSIRFT
ncbi:hypothetical protein TgHK011_004683 [Trichoderma gracile]|nr:hypothetical protein TgHK011_004683 [Trichoderma gracile]